MSTEHRDSISQFAPKDPYELQGSVYAWGKTARLMAEPAYFETRDQIKTDLIAVDLCSSFPYFREVMTGQHKQLMHTEASRTTGKFIDGFFRSKVQFVTALDTDTRVLLRNELAPKHGIARQLLIAPIFEILANPPSVNRRNVESIFNTLFEKFMHSDKHYEFVYEPTGKPAEKGTWVFIAPIDNATTFQKIIKPILRDKTPEFIKDISLYFAEKLASNDKLRRITFLSLDIAPLDDLIKDAKNGFPPKLQSTFFFQSIQKPERHMRADIRLLRFKENSIGFFSSIEGWPYYGKDFGFDGNMEVAKRISSQLAPGGKAVFFPWSIQDADPVLQNILSAIEKKWLNLGLIITKNNFTVDEILVGMTDRELMLANHSPILRQSGVIQSLILSKPNI